jgi:hypothetical protein
MIDHQGALVTAFELNTLIFKSRVCELTFQRCGCGAPAFMFDKLMCFSTLFPVANSWYCGYICRGLSWTRRSRNVNLSCDTNQSFVLAIHSLDPHPTIMSYEISEDAYHGTWTQSSHEQSSEAYGQGASGCFSRSRQTYPQPGIDTAYYPYQSSSSGGAQYSYAELGASRASYIQNPASSSSAYHVPGPMNTSAGAYTPSTYTATPQYTQQ